MSIKDLTITDQNVQSTYVQSQPDRLTGTAQQNKAAFDAYPALIRQRFNQLLEALAGTGGAGEIQIGPIEGVTAKNVQQALEAIQQNLSAYINKIKAATGAAEVGVSPIGGLEADNVQAALQALRTIQSEIDQNVQTIMSKKGAETVGVAAIPGMTAQNVQQALVDLRTAIDNIVSGIIPGGSITADMIQDGAIVQLGALLAIAAAAAYDPEGSYAVGDYCTHGGKLHKCNTPIPSGEAWNAEHWTETTVAAEMAEIRASLSNKIGVPIQIPEHADLNDYTTAGLYYAGADDIVATIFNTPTTHAFSLLVEIGANAQPVQTLKTWNDGNAYKTTVFVRSGYPEWGDGWQKLATAMQSQEHAIVPKNGATLIDGLKNSYSKDQFGRVFVFFSLHFESLPEKNTEIFSLPQSFAPTGGHFVGAAVLSMSVYFPALVTAHTNGMVTVGHNVTGYSGPINLHGFLVIDTGGAK